MKKNDPGGIVTTDQGAATGAVRGAVPRAGKLGVRKLGVRPVICNIPKGKPENKNFFFIFR